MTVLTSPEELLAGFERAELEMHYQLIFDTATRKPHSVEALIRWQHPYRGLLMPPEFLPLMAGGLGSAMVKTAVTRFALVEAIGQAGVWRSAGHDIAVSVNVAPCALVDEWVVECIANLLERELIPAEQLTIEVTEHFSRFDCTRLRDALQAIAALGVRLSLDDFGTGDATLARLHNLPFDEIKIDRQFVANISKRAVDRNIVAFSAHLADSLGMAVVAEGVESREVLDALADLGPMLVQGHYLHQLAPAADVPLLFAGIRPLDPALFLTGPAATDDGALQA